MANGSRTGTVLIAFVVGVGVGFIVARITAPPPQGATAVVYVGPAAANVSQPSVTLSKRNGDRVVWFSTNQSKTLLIEFAEQPFSGMQRQGNGRYRVPCESGTCNSGSILPAAAYKDYKYWQILVDAAGARDEADGHIIIQK